MKQLQDRIRREGRVLPGNIVKVDGFLNHRVDTALLGQIADEFARVFDTENITLVLTAVFLFVIMGATDARAPAGGEIRRSHDFCQEGQERQHRGRPVSERDLLLYL